MPKAREGHSLSAYKNLLVMFGGCQGGGSENQPFDDIWVVDIESKAWTRPETFGKKPEPREGHAAGVIRNTLIVYGGSGTRSLLSDVYLLNLTSFEWKEAEQHGAVLGPRESMSAAIVNEHMYVFGGNVNNDRTSDKDEYTDDLFQITLKGSIAQCKKLIAESQVPPKRLSHSLSNLNNRYLILFGGESFGKAVNDLWVYMIDKNIWHEIKPSNQISVRMAHVCYCYKDSVMVFGGMSHDQTVKSDLAILKFGRSEINISNGSGVNPKRKITKIMNVTARTVPNTGQLVQTTSVSSCQKCGHSPSTCKFLEQFPELGYPVLNYFPLVQICASSMEQLAALFVDPFAAMIRVAEGLETANVAFSIVGTACLKGGQVCKIMASDSYREGLGRSENEGGGGIGGGGGSGVGSASGKQQELWKNTNVVHVPILEIYTKLELRVDQFVKMCTGVGKINLLPAFFKLSATAVMISRTPTHLAVALLHKAEEYVPLFLAVFDNTGEPMYPNKELVNANMVNVYSRSHLHSADVFKHKMGTSIYLYTPELESIVGDILHQGSSFSQLVSKLKNVQYVVAGSLIKRDKQSNRESVGFQMPFLSMAYTNHFSVLVYVKKRLVYWEFKKNEKGKRAREDCVIIKLVDEDMVNSVTGMIVWNLKSMHLFGDVFPATKRRAIE